MNYKIKTYPILFLILLALLSMPALAETQTIQLQTDWNMISIAVNQVITSTETSQSCSLADSIYHYNQASGLYDTVNTLQPGLGYWVRTSSPCTITANGNRISSSGFPALKAGQNQIGSLFVSTKFSDIKGNCNVLMGPTKYDPATRSYVNVSIIEPGLGYWVAVENDCTLTGGGEVIVQTCSDGTAYGNCNATNKPKYCSNGNLVNNCTKCGCPTGQSCNATTNNCYTPVQKCSDGTAYGSCNTTNKPKYCSNGNLINNCTYCGCPSGQSCNATTNACYTPVQKCTDGTVYGQCNATNKPKYCDNGNLVNKCTVCGCPTGQSCNVTTNNCYTPISTCTCGTWTNGACGGSCGSGYRQQTRTCTPTGCTPSDGLGTIRCVADISCGAPAQFQVTVDSSKVIGINNLSLGVQAIAQTFSTDTAIKQLAKDANLKMVRFFEKDFMPCTKWNESSKTGTFDWTNVDALVRNISSIGAEPLITLGYLNYDSVKNDYFLKLPSGMTINPTTGLPYPDQWAAYCREWVKHFKTTGKPVRYYEIVNEPAAYFGWANYTRIDYFIALFNATAQVMRTENPSVLLSFEGSERKPVLNYWLNSSFKRPHQVGANLDSISFHKYDSGAIGQYSDAQLFNRAETFMIITSPGGPEDGYYGIKDSRQIYYNSRGKWIPVINSESNLDSAFITGADPRIQQMAGAIWTALVLRAGIINGLNQNIYFIISSSQSWEKANKANGFGFGMINDDNNKPYFPYYVNKMIGSNLAVGDSIVNSYSSSADIKTIAWNDNGKLNILIIHNSTGIKTVSLNGVTGTFNYQKIDDPSGTTYPNPALQTGTVNAGDTITLNDYTVMLLQFSTTQSSCDSQCKAQGFNSGTCKSGTSGIGILQVCGTSICDETGKKIYLKGVTIDKNERMKLYGSTGDALPGQTAWFTSDDVKKINQSGGNVVELQIIALKNIMPTRDVVNQSFFVDWIDKWVSWCEQNKVYCVIEVQGFEYRSWGMTFPDWLWQGLYVQPTSKSSADAIIRDFFDTNITKQDVNRQALIDAWKFIANRYKSNKYVIFSLINEPLMGADLINRSTSIHLGMTYSTLMENVIDGIRSTGAQQIISIDKPFVWYLSDVQPVNRNNNVTWETHMYVSKNFNITDWKSYLDQDIQKFVYDFNKPLIVGEFGTDDPSGCVNITGWQKILPEQVAYLDSKPLAGRWWHTWGGLYGEYGWFNCPAFNSTESDFIIKTVLGGSTSGSCQSGETNIGQDGCTSENLCCCKQTTSCTCGTWTNGACGSGGCSSTQRQQTRTCSPTGCTPSDGKGYSQCVADSTCGVTTSGLVGYWSFNDCTAKDSSGLGNDGTNYGATCIGGQVGNAFGFNGASNYVQILGGSSLSGFTVLTASFWIKPEDNSRRQTILNKYNNVNGSKGWFIDTPSYGGNYIGFFASLDGSNYAQWSVPFAPTLNSWYHIAVVWQANKVPTFYINGQQVSTTDTATISSIYNNVGVPLLIGKSQYATGREFNGTIDEVKIWNRALTADEVLKEYGGTVQTCICSTWTNGNCGGSCSSGYRQQTRTCTPSGCTPTDGLGLSRCVADSSCNAPAQFQVTVDSSKVIGTNNFSIGFMTDWSWPTFISDNARRQLVKDANFKLVRVFDFRTTSPKIMPCSNWDTTKNNCTLWNWTQVDSFTQTVFGIGAEPMFTLGWASDNTQNYIPPGMPINSTTGLPNPGSYAAYAAEWVKHFKQKGWPVRYYEIMNEPFAYFGWNPSPSNNLKLTYYVDLWNVVARAMRQQNPNILLSQDAVTQTNVLNYWLLHGDDVDYLDFHKYDCGVWNKSDPAYYSDSKLFSLAESSHFESTGSFYGLKESQQKWLTNRGKLLPVIESEGNLNSAWQGGTDPRIQQMVGAVWTALELRQGILKGLQYNVYYEFSSSSKSNPVSGGYGFGMIDSYNNKPWYPYYVQKWIGNNLGLGDDLVQSAASSNNIRTLSWIDKGKLNILLIHNSTATETVSLNGITGTFNYSKIDDPSGTSYLNPTVQTGTFNAGNTIALSGYTVMLLHSS